MSSKSGLHLVGDERKNFEAFLATIRDAGAELPVVHIVDSFGVAEQIKAFLPNTRIIGRKNDLDGQHLGEWQDSWNADPRGAAEDYYAKVKPTWDAHPLIDTWGYLNEANNPFYKEQADFNIRMLELTDKPLCMWNSSVGTPDYWSNDKVPYESVARSCKVAKASELAHVLGLHEYAFVTDLLEEAYKNHELGPHLVLRYRRLATYLESQDALIPIILTEVGQGGGYRFVGNEAWMADMRWYDSEVRKDGYVESVAWWTLGKWDEANIENVLPEFADYIVAEHTDPPPDPEPPTPEPEREYARHAVLIPQTTTALEDAELANRYDRRVTIIRSADDAFILPGVEWPTQLVRLDVDVWGVRRIAGKLDLEEAKQALDNFIDTYHPVRETNIEFNLKYFEFATAQPPPPDQDPKEFTLKSPVPDIAFRITSPFDAPRDYGPHEGIDLDSWDNARDRAAWVYPAQEGTIHKIVPAGSGLGYGNYVILRHAGPWLDGHIYYTWYAHLEYFADLEIGQFVTFTDPLGMSGKSGSGTTAIHLHFPLQDYKKDDNGNEVAMGKGGYWIPSVKDPTPLFIDESPPPTEPPPEETHVPETWLHLAATGVQSPFGLDENPVLKTDVNMVCDARIQGIKWTSNSDKQARQALAGHTGIPREKMILRLFMPGNDANLLNPDKWFELQREQIYFVSKGPEPASWIELHNEPNLPEEWPLSANEFAAWFSRVALLIKSDPDFGDTAKIMFPGLSPKPNTRDWYTTCYTAIKNWADAIGIHCYFSTDGSGAFGIDNDSVDQAGGLYWKNIIDWVPPDLPIFMTEFADNGDGSTFDRARRTVEYYTKQYPLRIRGLVCYISQDVNFPKQAWDKNPHMVGAVAQR